MSLIQSFPKEDRVDEQTHSMLETRKSLFFLGQQCTAAITKRRFYRRTQRIILRNEEQRK